MEPQITPKRAITDINIQNAPSMRISNEVTLQVVLIVSSVARSLESPKLALAR